MVSWLFLLFGVLSAASAYENEKDIPMIQLSNGKSLPLVGMGVGNLAHDAVRHQVAMGMNDELKYRLVDTAHASGNEELIRDGILEGLKHEKLVHVVTKVWYTYLGYERTKISVTQSLQAMRTYHDVIRVHILIHWPRCDDKIPWMKCEQEEAALPQYVQDAGPPPHLFKDQAWKESWRALEDIVLGKVHLGEDLPPVESIGVSNFGLEELREFEAMRRVPASILQHNIWNFVFDPHLVQYCNTHRIHFQAYNVMNGIFRNHEKTPNALELLWSMGRSMRSEQNPYTPPQLVLKWLSQNNVSTVPRTSKEEHLKANSPVVIAAMPELTERQLSRVHDAVVSMLRERDVEQPQVSFLNHKDNEQKIHLFWTNEHGEEIPVQENIEPGDKFHAFTFTGHVFVAYDHEKTKRQEFTVGADYGEIEEIRVEL